jgi:hypothetical protein
MENLFSGAPALNEVYDLKGSWIDRHAAARGGGRGARLDSDWPPYRRLNVSQEAAEALLGQVCSDALFLSSCNVMDYSLLLGIHHVTEHRLLREHGGLTRVASLASTPKGGAIRADDEDADEDGGGAGGSGGGRGGDRGGNGGGNGGGGHHELMEGPRSYSAVVLEGPGLYRLGVIDLLQEWSLKKRLERWAKIVFKGRCARHARDGMTAIEPQQYSWRFVEQIGVKLLGVKAERVREAWVQAEDAQRCASKRAASSRSQGPTISPGASVRSAGSSVRELSRQASESTLKQSHPHGHNGAP